MSKHANGRIISTNLDTHPAVKAWAAMQSQRIYLQNIMTIKEKLNAAVYRLHGVRPYGSVIAKRYKRDIEHFERFCYETILPHLPVSTLKLYGCIDEPDSEYSWLFLEDAGDDAYSPQNEEHRALVVEYLSSMHTSTWCDSLSAYLPDRGPNHYLEHLRSASERILSNRNNSTLSVENLEVLDSIISKLEQVASNWDEIVSFCAGMPYTIVHGDFVSKNLRVRTGKAGLSLLLFDWETVGYGVPAADLAKVDCDAYWLRVREHWTHLNIDDIKRLAFFGKIFRVIAGISWKSWNLEYGYPSSVIKTMRIYESRIDELIRDAGWG